jgi:hypothetical protein
MANSFRGASVNSMGPEDDDTIEMELSESAMRLLYQAAALPLEPSCPTTKNPAANAPEAPAAAARKGAPRGSAAPSRQPRFGMFFAIVAAASALLTAVVYLASARVRRPDSVAPRVVAAPAAPVSATPSPPSSPSTDATPVRFVNPFDRKEVFEFPPGTSAADAREAVAELLSQRARERQSLLTKVPHRSGKTADRISPVTPNGLAPRG